MQSDIEVRKGKIIGFRGSWQSGLATLIIDDADYGIVHIPCDNAPTVRALEGAFGDVIGEGHTVKEDGGYVGQEIYYSVDFVGVLEAFTPVEEAQEELVKLYKKHQGR